MSDASSVTRRRRSGRGWQVVLAAAALVTCTSDHPTGLGRFGRGYLAIRPVLSSPVDLAAFGLTIDSLRVVAIRPVADTALDTTAFFSPDSAALHLSLAVILHAPVETFVVHFELKAGSLVLFMGIDTVQVASGPPDTSSVATDTLQYVGPGAGLTALHIAPRDSVITLGDSLRFTATADQLGVPVTSFYVHWSTSDSVNVPVNGAGLLRAPNARGSVLVRAVTPNAVRDSTRVTFVPVPAAVAAAAGTGQTGTVGTRLPAPLRARVTASDLLGVQGVSVRFQVVTGGGTLKDSVVLTDSLGFAEDTATLGTVAGSQTFRASVGVLPPATFTATATAGAISTAQSVVTVSSATIASGTGATLTLQGKDAFGNTLTTGGATVVFTTTGGGTSTGTIGPTTDHADGTYTATFTGLTVGTATTIAATINGTAVTTTLPTITVTAGAISPLTSVVSTSSGTVSSGATATLTLLAKDSVGNSLTTGGATVVFSRSGGTSTGTIGPTTDHANGTYSAVFTADSAGTATTIHATIGGVLAASTTTITVVPGNTTAAQSVITVSADTIQSGGTSTLTLQAKDSAGNNITTGGLTVIFSHSGGTSAGSIAPSPATDNNNGTYTATFTGQTAGTATTIHATIGGVQVTSTLPTITVITSGISIATSVVTSTDSVLPLGGVATLTLQAKDAAGNVITSGGATVVFTQGGGTSTGTIGATTDHADGTYSASFTGTTAGTPTTIGATINGNAVTSVPLPTIRVFSSVHTADITADSTWTAAASPHIVSAYIHVRNGATLTIQPGATVKFDAGAGLQVGDTAANEAGGLILNGTAAPIVLTANSVTPTPGFWQGIEVQRSLAVGPWRRVLIEWGGGTRSNPFNQACVLIANASGTTLDLDSLHIRQCVHAGIHHFGGTAHVHRSEIDTVTGSAIHADFDARLELDSTVVIGTGGYGVEITSDRVTLGPSSSNRLLGHSLQAMQITAVQLPGVLRQDSLGGDPDIVVTAGQPDSTVAAFTIFHQPGQGPGKGYRVTGGSLDVGRVGGQAVTLDSNLTLIFSSLGGLRIGENPGVRSGTIRSLGTNSSNQPVLTAAPGGSPSFAAILQIERLAAADTLKHVLIENGAGFGLRVSNPAPALFVLDSAVVQLNAINPINSNGGAIVVDGSDSGGAEIRNSIVTQNLYNGIRVNGEGFKIIGNTISSQTRALTVFRSIPFFAPLHVAAGDSISGNTFQGNGPFSLFLDPGALPALQSNTFAASDSVVLFGNRLTVDATLPRIPGHPWHVLGVTIVDSNAVFTIAPGDTVAFDSSGGIVVGDLAPAALVADGTAGRILLTASGPLPQGWRGIDWHLMSGSGSTTNNVFRHVDVDRAGFIAPCFGDCSPIPFGALRFTDSLTATNVNLSITDLIVRRSNAIALDFERGGTGTVDITAGQFYLNRPDPMIRARSGHGNQLSISGSDLHHYRGHVIESSYRSASGADSVLAANNWWGDVLGADTSFLFQDSLGQATTQFSAAVITPFATTPFFPIGPAVGMVTTTDSLLPQASLGGSAGIHARVVDANGRGVAGQTVSWTPLPAGASSIAPSSSSSDLGGRVDAGWTFTNTAGRLNAHATGGGGFTDYFIDVLPGASTAVNWTALGGTFTQGTVTGPKAITFTSTNRRGVVVTNSHDSFNNATQPFNLCFTDINVSGCTFPFPAYGVVDSTHTSGGVAGDTIFFHASVNTPSPFILRATYNTLSGQVEDSVVITMIPGAAGVKIDRDEFTFGVQATPDTAVFNSLCPGGQPNFYCQREFHAFVVDSGLAPIGNQNASFQWNLLPPTGAPVTFTTRGAPANDTARVDAQADGFARLVAKDVGVNAFGSDTLPILVHQVGYYIVITPDSASVLIGNTTTFQATVVDLGNEPLAGDTVHWRFDPVQPGKLTIVDTSVFNQVTVRMDSTPFGSTFLTAFWGRPLADTAFGYSPFDTLQSSVAVFNPVQTPIAVGGNPYRVAVNPVTNRVYVSNVGSGVSVLDGASDAILTTVDVGGLSTLVAVNPTASSNRVFVARITTLGSRILSFSGATNTVGDTSGGGGIRPTGMAVDTARNRVYVTANSCFFDPQQITLVCNPIGEVQLIALNGDTLGQVLAIADSTPGQGRGMAYNPATDRIYVAVSNGSVDTVKVIDAATLTAIDSIAVGSGAFGVAVNPVTNRIYVTNETDGTVSVIDGATNAVVATVFLGFSTFPEGLGVDPNTSRIYVSEAGVGVMRVIDGVTNTEIGQIFVGGISTDAQPNPVTDRFYVPLSQDGVVKSFRFQ